MPWITKGLIISIRNRDKLNRDLNTNFSIEKYQQYKQFRNNLNNLIKITKNNFYGDKIKEAGNNMKKVWETVNEVTNIKKS